MNNLLNNIKKLSKDIKIEIIYSKNKNYKCVKTFKTLHNDPINNLIVYQIWALNLHNCHKMQYSSRKIARGLDLLLVYQPNS